MEQVIIGILIVFVVGLVVGIFLLLKKKPEKQPDALVMLQQQMNHITQVLDSKLSESTKAIQSQFGQSAKIIQEVTEKLTRLDEIGRAHV